MKIIHKERISVENQTILQGCIAINVESFIPPGCIRPSSINRVSVQMYTPFLYPFLYDMSGCCVIYKNKDRFSELVYIHDVTSLGFPSHQSLIDSKRLVNGSIDLSGLIIPEYYDVMEHIPKDGHPHVPHVNIEEIILDLETLSLDNKKKYISIALFSSLYNPIKKAMKYGTYTRNYSDIQFNIEKILDIAEEHNIIIHREVVIDWVMDGINYLGFKKYTKSDILALDRAHVTRINSRWFRSMDPIPETIVFALPIRARTRSLISPLPLIGDIITYNDERNHVRLGNGTQKIKSLSDEFYNDICIPEIIHYLKTKY